jgi:hypothetical protein
MTSEQGPSALEHQLQRELHQAQEELHRVRREADRRILETTRTASLAIQQAHAHAPAARPRGTYLGWGVASVLASALILIMLAWPATAPERVPSPIVSKMSCTESSPQAPSAGADPMPLVGKVVPPKPSRPSTPRPHVPGSSRRPAGPGMGQPTCDGTDPLCGLPVGSMLP